MTTNIRHITESPNFEPDTQQGQEHSQHDGYQPVDRDQLQPHPSRRHLPRPAAAGGLVEAQHLPRRRQGRLLLRPCAVRRCTRHPVRRDLLRPVDTELRRPSRLRHPPRGADGGDRAQVPEVGQIQHPCHPRREVFGLYLARQCVFGLPRHDE